MSWHEKRFESLLFNYETTGRTDFRNSEIQPVIKTKFKEKPSCLRIRPPALKDHHSLTDWKIPNVPFNLMHEPKDIVQTNPWVIQKECIEPEDNLRELVRKTRPRLVMTPAISLDDIKDSNVRNMLVDDVYTTTLAKTNRNANIKVGSNVRAPLSPVMAPANPITLHKLVPPYVSPEWRMESAMWDGHQLRAYCEPHKEFWLARSPICEVCNETAERKMLQKMEDKSKH